MKKGSIKNKRLTRRSRALICLVVASIALGFPPAIAGEARLIDVVAITWAGAGAVRGSVDQVASVINNEVGPRWKTLTTLYGDSKDRSISFAAGQLLAGAINLSSPMPCTGAQSNSFIGQVRAETYKRFNISDYSSRYLVIISPAAGCVWSGRALVGESENTDGVLILHDTISEFVIAHELGHTFGLGHSNFIRCANGASDGAWSADCKAVEYGGVIDLMGNINTTSPLSTYHQWRMGLLNSADIKQSWANETINLAPSDYASGTRAIFLRDGRSTYWVEYRRSTNGVTYSPGLVVYRTDPPPISSVVSPNPEDLAGAQFGTGVGIDVWMLNLANYKYLATTVAGSMTLPSGIPTTFYSGNLSLVATPTGDGVAVTITRKSVATDASAPILTDTTTWKFPSIELIKSDNSGSDIAIASYQIKINETISDVPISFIEKWKPTYLNPFSAPKTVRVSDLPEGTYSLSLRSVDVNGGKSSWSTQVLATIDRGRPIATNEFALSAINSSESLLTWTGATDTGSGLCLTNLINEDGLVLQSSIEKSAPKINVKNGVPLNARAELFDCIGNGIMGDLSINNTFTSASKSGQTGKWSPAPSYGQGALTCVGKCTASFLAKGRVDILMGNGKADVLTGLAVLAKVVDSTSGKMRVGASVDLGLQKKIVRISGSNFTLVGLGNILANFTNVKNIDRLPTVADPTLADAKQLALAKFGFSASDFNQDWSILPMNNGTTLLDATLDLCSGLYPSEKNRSERRQISAIKKGSGINFLSTEVVRYSSPAAAEGAIGELKKILAQCQNDKGYKDLTGTFITQTFSAFPALPNGLVGETARVLVRSQINTGANARQLLALYQYSGELFTGLYIIVNGDKALTDAQVKNWLQVGVTMANRLSGKSV